MSNRPPFKQMFDFERSAIQLEDGSIFQPLRDSAHRFNPMAQDAQYHHWGSYIDVVYQLDEERFVQIVASCPYRVDRAEKVDIIPTRGTITGRWIGARDVVRFLLDSGAEVPDFLQSVLEEMSKPLRERDPLPLSHWNDPKAMVSEHKNASTQNVTELLRKLHRFAIDAVHEIEDWGDTDVDQRCTKLTVHLAWRLRDRYRVEHGTWWGKDSVPPKSVDILRLRWPKGLREVGHRVIKTLRHQVTEAAMVLNGHESLSLYPTRAEREAAQKLLLTNLEVIKTQIIDLGKLLADADSGIAGKAAQEKTKIDEPLRWKCRAWRMDKAGIPQKDIATKVRRNPGTVSRAIREVADFFGLFGYVPEDTPRPRRAKAVDPSRLDMRSKSAKRKKSSEEE